MKIINSEILDSISTSAKTAVRQRKNWNLHEAHSDIAQRFLNAMEPETYVCPHLHDRPNGWENLIIIRGKAAIILFSENGILNHRTVITTSGPNYSVEIPPRTWHTVLSLEQNTVIFELKLGPYHPETDKTFANWAPKEGDADCFKFKQWYEEGELGSKPPISTI